MKRSNIFCFTFSLLLITTMAGCGAAGINSKSELNFDQLVKLVNDRHFEIENRWALPLRGGRIDLIGNPNYVRFKGENVEIFLPYFGVRQAGGGFNRETGISYKGPAKDFTMVENKEKQSILLRFRGQSESESMDFSVTIFPNKRAYTTVTSMQRDAITYDGILESLPDENN